MAPENCERTLRLEAATAAAQRATGDAVQGQGDLARAIVDAIEHDDAMRRLSLSEDPLPGPICSEILFFGHGHLVLPGQDPEGVFTLEIGGRRLFPYELIDVAARQVAAK